MITLLTLAEFLLLVLALVAALGAVVYVVCRSFDAPRFDYDWLNVLWSALFDPEPTNPVPPQWRL